MQTKIPIILKIFPVCIGFEGNGGGNLSKGSKVEHICEMIVLL